LPLKNKTNQFFLPFICCRLGRSRIEKEKKRKGERERERKVREKY
jgi:stalled ribosome alternative rescue factor ArfA